MGGYGNPFVLVQLCCVGEGGVAGGTDTIERYIDPPPKRQQRELNGQSATWWGLQRSVFACLFVKDSQT